MRFARLGLFTIAAIGLVGSLGYIVYTPPPAVPAVFADLSAESLDGTTVSFVDYAGDILVVDFWATWCGPCITEIPHYNAFEADYRDKGVSLLGLTVQSGTPEDVLEWIAADEKHGIEYPLLMSNDNLMNTFGPIFGFPTTLVVDTDGTIVKRWIGATVGKTDELRKLVDEMLGEEHTEADHVH